LQELVDVSESFQSVVASGALEGLSELSNDNTNIKEIYLQVAAFILQNTDVSKDYFIRAK
jgi:aminopeptidase N